MVRNKLGYSGLLFLGCAAFSFALLRPQIANSAYRNIAGAGCSRDSSGSYFCPIVTDDNYTVANISGAYFDFICPSSGRVEYSLNKLTFTGSFYSDTGSIICTGVSSKDEWVAANRVKTNASRYDYLWATVFSATSVYGIQAVF